MKSIYLILTTVLLSASMMGCSQTSSNSAACNKAGYYGDQTECQNSVSLGTCASTTVTSGDKNLVCWKSSTTSAQTGNTTGSTTGGTTGCSGASSAPWTLGAWTPATCTAGVSTRTRTVTCDYACGCSSTQPSATETCTPNMYQAKHYESECTSAGGSLDYVEGNRICRFNGSGCPGNWNQLYYNGNLPYTITTPGSAQEHTNCHGGRNTVYTGSHGSFSPAKMVETLVYCGARNCFGCTSWSTASAIVTQVACY